MSSIGLNLGSHKANIENKDDGAQPQGSRDLVVSWLNGVQRYGKEEEDPMDNSTSPGRERVGAAQRFGEISSAARSHHGAAVLTPFHPLCYRIREDGVPIAAKGHPFACACSQSGRPPQGKPFHMYIEPLLCAPLGRMDDRQKYLSTAFNCCAPMCYPLTRCGIMSYNPLEQPQIREHMISTPLAVESLLAVGATIYLMCRPQQKKSKISTLNVHFAYVHRMIDESIGGDFAQTLLGRRLILQALYCLSAAYIGLGDSVALHAITKQLEQFRESTDPEESNDPHDLTRERMDAIDRAIFNGFLLEPSPRKGQVLPCLLSSGDIGHILSTLRPRLTSSKINMDTADTVIATCIFTWTMDKAQRRGIGQTFEPDALQEDYDFLQIDLLNSPRPLLPHFSTTKSSGISAFPSKYDSQDILNAFEDAVRVTTLICLRAATIQTSPRSRTQNTRLLDRLVNRLQIILEWMYSDTLQSAYVNPTLLHEQQEDQGAMLSVSGARPFLIWMSMIGYQLSVYSGIFHQGWSAHHPEDCIYLKTLAAMGISDTTDVDLCARDDVAIFDMLNLNWGTDFSRRSFEVLRWVVMR